MWGFNLTTNMMDETNLISRDLITCNGSTISPIQRSWNIQFVINYTNALIIFGSNRVFVASSDAREYFIKHPLSISQQGSVFDRIQFAVKIYIHCSCNSILLFANKATVFSFYKVVKYIKAATVGY